MRIHWHRRDLRPADNRGLVEPDETPVVPLFIFDESVLTHGSPPRVSFLLDALAALRSWYRDRGSDLLIAHGNPTLILPDLAGRRDASVVSFNRDYSGLAQRRDEAVRTTLQSQDVAVEGFHDAVCQPPGSILSNSGDPYAVYSYFWRKWRDRPVDQSCDPPGQSQLADESGDPLPTLGELGFEEPSVSVPPAGFEVAEDRLSEFLAADVFAYGDRRDYPADRCTSRLSPHLKFGTIGIREVDDRVRATRDGATGEERESVVEFRSQLAWRDFYLHVLYFHPETVRENFQSFSNPIAWEDDSSAFAAWKAGQTGYPIVDAGMRQLSSEGFMHNRVRMIVASFLTKDLLIDWRRGYAWFKRTLVDHDTANEVGGWQWAASTGTDAQPYFRIFNPMLQGERYDPAAEYISEYVAELAGVSPEVIHGWHELDAAEREAHAPGYPAPIVDHAERREAAIAMFEAARGGAAE